MSLSPRIEPACKSFSSHSSPNGPGCHRRIAKNRSEACERSSQACYHEFFNLRQTRLPKATIFSSTRTCSAKLMYRKRKTYVQSSVLSLMRMSVLLFPDAYLRPNSKLTHNLTSKSCTLKLANFFSRIFLTLIFRRTYASKGRGYGPYRILVN